MAIHRGDFKLLVIEDNPGDTLLVEGFLFEQIDAPQITSVATYQAAVATLSTSDAIFDAILLDLSLPDKTGEVLIKGILEISGRIPVIVLADNPDFAFGASLLSLGVSDYILKDDLNSLALYKSIVYSIERKKATAELLVSEKSYAELFHASPLSMWVFDVNTLMFLDVNMAAIEHYGYSREEFLTMTIADIRPDSEVPVVKDFVARYRNDKTLRKSGVFLHKKRNGELINVDIQSNSINYAGKSAKIVVVNDVTQRLKYLKAIEEQNKKLREISWMQSHVIRAPLSRIMGLIPLIKNPIREGDLDLMLEYLMISAEELDKVIKDITDRTTDANFELPPDASEK